MIKRKIKIERIQEGNFRPFGRVIEIPEKGRRRHGNLWRILLRQPRGGWRIAYLVVRDRGIRRLEQHPDTYETFEPVRGKSLLYVASKKDPANIRCFYLEKPVILNKGVWHGVVTLSGETEIKIVENASVRCVYWKLGIRLGKKERY